MSSYNDFDFLMRNMLPGIIFGLLISGSGWLLARRGLISKKFADRVIYPLAGGVFTFFLFGYAFPDLNLVSRLLVTVIFWPIVSGITRAIKEA